MTDRNTEPSFRTAMIYAALGLVIGSAIGAVLIGLFRFWREEPVRFYRSSDIATSQACSDWTGLDKGEGSGAFLTSAICVTLRDRARVTTKGGE